MVITVEITETATYKREYLVSDDFDTSNNDAVLELTRRDESIDDGWVAAEGRTARVECAKSDEKVHDESRWEEVVDLNLASFSGILDGNARGS